MYKIEVGQPYIPGKTQWPEAVEYNFRGGMHELRMFLKHLTQAQIEAFNNGAADFAMLFRDEVLFFLYRMSIVAWGDAVYTWHLVPEDQRVLPEDPPEGHGALLTIILVEATTGIVKGIRIVTMPHKFTVALHNAIRTQAAHSFDEAAYDAALSKILDQYTNKDLKRQAQAWFRVEGD